MRACFAIDIETPKKFLLRGLWFGPQDPKRVIIFIHGLGGSMFSMSDIVGALVDPQTAVVTFNNRGHDVISHINKRLGKNTKRLKAGSAHEIFTECADDIQGAIAFVKRSGVKNIFLAGHSTGCQKSAYWASKSRGGRDIKGIILLAPVSDWAGEMKRQGESKVARAAKAARALVRANKKHTLLPENIWYETLDAQRFLSLYTPDSPEEIFSYAQPKKKPRVLQSVKVPLLVLWAGADEYNDRPVADVLQWFNANMRAAHGIVAIADAPHSFKGSEKEVAMVIREFIRA